jgi:transposase
MEFVRHLSTARQE